jgi:hypothetical protein
MKRLFLSLILASTFVGSMPAMEVAKKVIDSIAEVNKKTNYLIPSLIGSYALGYSLVYAHELGHALSAKLLLGASSKIYVSPFLSGGETFYTHFSDKFDNLSTKSKKKRMAMISLAGPLAGLAAGALALKSYNIFIECSRNSSDTLLQACLKGLQKSLFNNEQSLWILISVVRSLLSNINNGIDFGDEKKDISKALRFLNIHPMDAYPKISKFIQYLPVAALIAIGRVIGLKIAKTVMLPKSHSK